MSSGAKEFEIVDVPSPGEGHIIAEEAAKLILQSIPEIAEPTREQVLDTVATEMDNAHFVAALDAEGAVVGTGGLYMKDIDGADKAFIINMAVAPSARQRGLGSRLMTVLEEEAARRDATEILGQHHEGSLIFYTGLGYAPATRPFIEGDVLAKFIEK
ncbi:MAG: GNAT family N-acetyltransferase [Patescibacteria group bacterium]